MQNVRISGERDVTTGTTSLKDWATWRSWTAASRLCRLCHRWEGLGALSNNYYFSVYHCLSSLLPLFFWILFFLSHSFCLLSLHQSLLPLIPQSPCQLHSFHLLTPLSLTPLPLPRPLLPHPSPLTPSLLTHFSLTLHSLTSPLTHFLPHLSLCQSLPPSTLTLHFLIHSLSPSPLTPSHTYFLIPHSLTSHYFTHFLPHPSLSSSILSLSLFLPPLLI